MNPPAMNCDDCRDHFGELLYAERGEPLEERLSQRLKEHLRGCSACAEELRALGQAWSWLDVLLEQPAQAGAEEAGAQFVERQPQVGLYSRLARLERRRDVWRYAALAATAAAVLLLVIAAWPPRAGVDPSTGRGASLAQAPPAYDWGPQFQRLAARLEEQDRVLGLLAAELKAVEGSQSSRLFALEDQSGRMNRAAEFQVLRVSALQHDIDQMRKFITAANHVAERSAD